MSEEAVDTVRVVGGVGVTAVVAQDVRLAAARCTAAADHLRSAAVLCGRAQAAVARDALPWAGPQPALAAARDAAVAAADDAARCLRASAEVHDLLGRRLLRAAGLYEEAESATERIVGAAVTADGFVQGAFWTDGPRWIGGAAVGAAVGALAGAGLWLHDRLDGWLTSGVPTRTLASGLPSWAPRALAPWSDELVAGLGAGVAFANPRTAGGDMSVTGGAQVLARTVRDAPFVHVPTEVRVTRLGPDAFGSGAFPRWAGTGGSVAESLHRVADLYPWDGDAPHATVAVQRVTAADGATSWTVLIPGTESVLPAAHPWDAVTDLDLMAREADGATSAVRSALADAGAGPDEPVTLVGHSLGGIAAMALASTPAFTDRYRLGAVVTAGSPVASFPAPPGVPVLHLETAEEVVSSTDGRSSAENPRTADRVTVARTLSASSDALDQAASGSVAAAHSLPTHVRTLDLAAASGDVKVTEILDRISPLLDGQEVTTTFYRAERATPAISP